MCAGSTQGSVGVEQSQMACSIMQPEQRQHSSSGRHSRSLHAACARLSSSQEESKLAVPAKLSSFCRNMPNALVSPSAGTLAALAPSSTAERQRCTASEGCASRQWRHHFSRSTRCRGCQGPVIPNSTDISPMQQYASDEVVDCVTHSTACTGHPGPSAEGFVSWLRRPHFNILQLMCMPAANVAS